MGPPLQLQCERAQRVATGAGATNQSNAARVNGAGFTRIDQNNGRVNFTSLW